MNHLQSGLFFGDAGQFVISADEPAEDNLLIVTDRDTGDWYTVC